MEGADSWACGATPLWCVLLMMILVMDWSETMHVDVLCFVCQQPKIESIRTRMTERGVRLQELKEQMNGVEDEVFRKFCREIGVANIRSVSFVV